MASVAFILSEGPSSVAKHRTDMLNHYLARVKALHAQECALHDSLDEQIKPVMASKRLLLFKEMMDDAGVQDKELFSDMQWFSFGRGLTAFRTVSAAVETSSAWSRTVAADCTMGPESGGLFMPRTKR